MDEQKDFPKTLIGAISYFADADVAHNFVASMRWPNGKVTCPRCGSARVSFTAKRRVWTCEDCPKRRQFSVKVGTIMEDSPIPINKWLAGMWLIMSAKNGISSYELHRALGITQKSAWHLGHRIRLSLHRGSIEKMSGTCEADETYIGAKARNMHFRKRKEKIKRNTGGWHMTAVQGVLQRNEGKKSSKVALKVVPTTRKGELQGNVREYVLQGSTLCTDKHRSYDGLESDYDHQVIDHAERYAQGHVHTNGLENFWSLLKRSLKGTYVNVEPFHLFRYLDEQAFRFNERKATDSERFLSAVPSITGRRLTYKQLIGSNMCFP
jgi:transposase-like protein